jgi:hypothetical protein
VSILALAVVAALAGFWLLGREDPPAPDTARPVATTERKPTAAADADDEKTWTDDEIRAGLLGDWERTADFGHVVMTLREAGTGGMVIRLSGLNRTLVGERIDVDIAWQVEGGQVVFESLRGRPATAYAMVSAVKGDSPEREVLELSAGRVVFDDRADHEQEIWTRLASE